MKALPVALAPLALLGAGLVFDLVDCATGTCAFSEIARWALLAGLLGSAGVAPMLSQAWSRRHGPPGRFERFGLAAQTVALLLFAVAWVLRDRDGEVPAVSLTLEIFGAVVVLLLACNAVAKLTAKSTDPRKDMLATASPTPKNAYTKVIERLGDRDSNPGVSRSGASL